MTSIDPEHYLRERYHGERERSALLSAYYRAKPYMPRSLQLAMRRLYARRQVAHRVPPVADRAILVEDQDARLPGRLEAEHAERVPMVGFWPEGRRFAAILTHDVEGIAGVRNVRRVLEIERRHGFVSSWNFVAEWYPIEPGLFDHIRRWRRGRPPRDQARRQALREPRELRGRSASDPSLPARVGRRRVRSPATHRNAEWMPELGCLYDSSFPTPIPSSPSRRAARSSVFLDDLVELPMTLVQDHTLFEILRADSIAH